MALNVKPGTIKKWTPTRKWFAAAVAGMTPVILQAIDEGWHTTESKQAVVLWSGLLIAYIVPGDLSLPSLPVVRKGQ